MPKNDLIWVEADARFFEAFQLATDGEEATGLQDVLLMADALHGDVFTWKEVESAVVKLVAAQLITSVKSKLLPTPSSVIIEGHYENLLEQLQQINLTSEAFVCAKEVVKKSKLNNQYQQYHEQYG